MENTALGQIRLLVNLARADGEVGEKERQLIINIGQANHLMVAEILPLFSDENPNSVPDNLSADERFNYLVGMIRLMKIDGRLYQAEMQYCAEVASKLGYQKQVLFDLMLQLTDSQQPDSEMEMLKRLSSTYLRKG